MRLLTAITCLYFTLTSCQKPQEFNPFSSGYNLSLDQLKRHAKDTLNAGCGYLNLTLDTGRLIPYYQLYPSNNRWPWPRPIQKLFGRSYFEWGPQWTIVAKGFYYPLDSVSRENLPATDSTFRLLYEQLTTGSPDTSGLNNILNRYVYRIQEVRVDKIELTPLVGRGRKITLYPYIALSEDGQYLLRTINYLGGRPTEN